MRIFLRLAGLLVAIGIAAYLAAALYLFAMQRSYVFVPSGALASPAEAGLPEAEAITVMARDGTELTAWRVPAEAGRPTVLYFHGNAGSLSDRADRFRQIVEAGYGLMAPTYRGYPGSDGSPSQKALFSDALEAFDRLSAETDHIVLHGESLGTAIATYVAAERSADALILEAPFTAALDIAAATYPWIPVSLLMRDPFLSREYIKRVEEPVLIFHGTSDAVVPVEQGRRLFEIAREPKELVIIDGAGHGDLWARGLWPAEADFVSEVEAEAH